MDLVAGYSGSPFGVFPCLQICCRVPLVLLLLVPKTSILGGITCCPSFCFSGCRSVNPQPWCRQRASPVQRHCTTWSLPKCCALCSEMQCEDLQWLPKQDHIQAACERPVQETSESLIPCGGPCQSQRTPNRIGPISELGLSPPWHHEFKTSFAMENGIH